MNNSSLIEAIQNHINAGSRDAYTDQLIELAQKVITEQTSWPDQRTKLISLLVDLQALTPSKPHFLGSTATSL